MWLLAGEKAPDHSTIARFRKGYLEETVEDLFYQMVQYLHNLKEISYDNLFIDGTKIEAASKKTRLDIRLLNTEEVVVIDRAYMFLSNIHWQSSGNA